MSSTLEFEELSETECLTLLAGERLGRIAFVRKGRPTVLPVNYGLDDDVIVFRTGPGGKQACVPLRRVAFEVDHFDEGTGAGWSVVVSGFAYEITRAIDRRSEVRKLLSVTPAVPGAHDHWIEIVPEVITGRRLHAGRGGGTEHPAGDETGSASPLPPGRSALARG